MMGMLLASVSAQAMIGEGGTPLTSFSDDFNRANENLEDSADWSRGDGGAAGAMTISSNAVATVSTADGPYYQCPDLGSTDHYVQAKKPLASSYGDFLLCARLADADNFIGVRRWDTSHGNWSFYKRVAGTFTLLGSWDNPYWYKDDSVVRLEVVGDVARVTVDDILIASANIGTHTSSTRAGFVTRNNAINPAWDDFQHGILSDFSEIPSRDALLVSFDGVDEATSATDDGFYGLALTFNGNAKLDDGDSKFGTTSLLLDGTGDYVTAPNHADLSTSREDFTVEGWFKPSSIVAGLKALLTKRYTNSTDWMLQLDSGKPRLWLFGTSAIDETAASAISATAWTHIAVVRYGTSVKVFVNGTAVISVTQSGTQSTNQGLLYIGRDQTNSSRDFNGRIEELRISKGIAHYTSDFTPPSVPFPRS